MALSAACFPAQHKLGILLHFPILQRAARSLGGGFYANCILRAFGYQNDAWLTLLCTLGIK